MSHVTIPLNDRKMGPISGYGSCTDVGRVRDHNEDSLIAAPPLFAVADGMGGHAAGEVASEIAITVLQEQAPHTLDANALSNAVETANYAILRAVEDGRGLEGMGTTLTAAMVEGERLLIAQVGDSRAYLPHRSRLQQLTRDHSLMADLIDMGQITPEEAESHPQRSVITRALGSAVDTYPDLYELNVAPGDRLLLCSDGLSGMVSEEDLTEILTRFRDPQRCADQLIKRANMNGGMDNISAIVVDIEGNVAERTRTYQRKSRAWLALVGVLIVAVLGIAGFVLHNWVTTSAFLTEENGKVAIYQGIPDSFLGFSFQERIEITDINVDDLNAGLATRLRDGAVKTDNVTEAKRLADEYREDAQRNRALASNGVTTPTPTTSSATAAAAQ